MSTNSLSLYHYPITPPGLVIKGMNGPGVNHLPFPISNLWRLQLIIQKLVPAIQKLVPASQKLLPAIQKLLPAIQKLSAIQMLLVLRAHLLFGRRNHIGRLGKRSRTRRTGRRRTGLRRAGNRSGRRRAGRRRAGRRRAGRLATERLRRCRGPRVLGRKCLGEALFARRLEKGEGHERQEEKGLGRGPDHEPQARGQVGWRRAIYFLETASPHEKKKGLLVLFNLHAGWRVIE